MRGKRKGKITIGIRNVSGVKCEDCKQEFKPGEEIVIRELASMKNNWCGRYAHQDKQNCPRFR